MKIIDTMIDNPTIGIGVLLCLGLAILGLSFMTSAEGQNSASFSLTSDEDSHSQVHAMPMHTDDIDDSPFLTPVPAPESQTRRAVREQAVFALQPQELQQGSVRVPAQTLNTHRRAKSQQQQQTREQQATDFAGSRAKQEQPTSQRRVEKRDELLFRIVKMRLKQGEFEKLTLVVLQMQSPEKAIEAMLDFAEESDDENISKLLDVATVVTLQLGQPRPSVSGMMGISVGPGMPAGMFPGQSMPSPQMSK